MTSFLVMGVSYGTSQQQKLLRLIKQCYILSTTLSFGEGLPAVLTSYQSHAFPVMVASYFLKKAAGSYI